MNEKILFEKLKEFKGKTIKDIKTIENSTWGDTIIIEFTDNTRFSIYADSPLIEEKAILRVE